MGYKTKDFYFKKAQKEKYPARSVYKLKEIQKKYRLLKKGQRVLDLGAAPGSWSKYVLEIIGSKGLLIAIDLSPLKITAPNLFFLQRDIFDLEKEELWGLTKGQKIHAVLSDMAPKTTGNRDVDHFRSLELAQRALNIASDFLQPQGSFIVKVFEGEKFPFFVEEVKRVLGAVKLFRPQSTRSSSREIFVIVRKRSRF